MILRMNNKTFETKADWINSEISRSSGNELNSYLINFQVMGEKSFNKFKTSIEGFRRKAIEELDKDGKIIHKYLVKQWNYHYLNNFESEDKNYICNIEIYEIEDLFTKSIIIENIENNVLKYNERYDKQKDAIIITAVIKSTKTQWDEINEKIKNKKYFDVIRPEINSKVLKMRYGKNVWSKHKGYIKRKIVLVEENYDKHNNFPIKILDPELKNIMKQLAQNTIYIELLEKLLEEKGILDKNNRKELKEKVEEEYKEKARDFYLVNDAEKEFDDDNKI